MAKFKPYKILESQLDSLPIKEGQFILTTDTKKLYSDTAAYTRILISPDAITDLSINGKTITYTRLDGTTGTITTQDTTYSVASETKNGLMSSDDKAKLNAIESGAQKNTVTGVKGDSETLYRTGNINITKANIGLNNVENKSSATIRGELTSSNVTTALGYTPLNSNLKGANNGLAELDASGKVPTAQLPSYVDDVLEYSAKANFPTTGETGKIYVDTSTNKTYRWGGSAYAEISQSIALGTTSSTAFRGDYGQAAYTHAVTNKGNKFDSGLYKIATNAEGHVTGATAVAKSDITALGIPAQDTTYSAATTGAAGLMSAADKTKLDGIAAGAQKNTITGVKGNAETNYRTGNVNITAANIGLGNVENKSSETIRGELTKANVTTALGYTPPTTNTTYEEATTSKAGLMSAAMVTKLNGIETGAQKNTITGVKGNSESTYRTGNVNITKANIGLGNVDNTSDANKPVSTAQQTALDKKLNLSGGTLTGPVKWGGSTALPASSDLLYILGIDAFADGGQTKYIRIEDMKVGKATADGDGNEIKSTYKKLDGSNKYLNLTGGDGNTTGYRLVLQETMSTWENDRLVLSISSRHQGTGILSIGISTGATVAEFQQEARFYGSGLSYTTDSWIQYYNKETGVYTLFWKFNDYSDCYVNILEKRGFTSALQNGTWMTSIDATTYGDKYSVLINKASSASSADKATNDKNGKDITTTYVKKAGDTMTGDLVLSSSDSSDTPNLIFQRGTLTDGYDDWKVINSKGQLHFDSRGENSTSWTTEIRMRPKGILESTTITAAAALKSTEGTVDLANSAAQMKYNSTDKCIDFIFS